MLVSNASLLINGARSSHCPSNKFEPPMPTGPAMSGALPPANCVVSVLMADDAGTTSNLSVILSWLALKVSTTFFSCSGCPWSAPVPKPTNHVMVTCPPLSLAADVALELAADVALELAADVALELAADVALELSADVPLLLHATETRDTARPSAPCASRRRGRRSGRGPTGRWDPAARFVDIVLLRKVV